MNKEYIVIAFTENQIGVLNRITACIFTALALLLIFSSR